MRIRAEWLLAAFLGVASAAAYAAARTIGHLGSPESPLQTFYVDGFSRTLVETSVFLLATAICSALYAFSPHIRHTVHAVADRIGAYLHNCSLLRYAIVSFSATAALLFLLNASGILYGTFLIDDYKMYSIATERSATELVWTPINDHVIPLFWLELKAIFFFTGPNPPPLNFPLFAATIVAIGGAALLLRQLRFGPSTLVVLLGTFASTTVVSHQLYGFYAIAPYIQVLALFVLSLICFVRAEQQPRFARLFRMLSLALIGMALFLESGGIWTPVAYALCIYAFHILHTQSWDIRAMFTAHVWPLVTTATMTLMYFAYLIALPRFTTESFYGFNHLPLSLRTAYELYNVLTAGVLLSLFAPRLGLLVSQPRLLDFIVPWRIGMFILFCAFIALVVYTVRKGAVHARVLVPYFALITLGTSLLIAIARPSSNAAAFYRDQNLVFPLFFLALALAVFAHEWMRGATDESARHTRAVLVTAFLIVVFASQHVFSFYKDQYLDDITFNQSFTAHMRETLTPALNELSSSASSPLIVPSLSALFLNGGFHQLPELSAFSSFIDVHNVAWLPFNQGPYGASTSPAFIRALKNDDRLRQWYLADGEVQELCVAEPFGNDRRPVLPNTPVRIAASSRPAQKHMLYFDLSAKDAPEKIFIDIAFDNDFNATGTRAHIRIDQYTKTATAPERRYACAVDLNEIPAFALTRRVANLAMTITASGTYTLNGFEMR